MSVQNFFDGLSDEVKAKLKACKSNEEMNKVFQDANIALDEDVLEAVSGGIDIEQICPSFNDVGCPSLCPMNHIICPKDKPDCLHYVIDL